MRLALFEPDIPQNAGAMMRLAACLGLGVDVIGPCGFALSDRRMRRAGMDYLDHVAITRHDSWDRFVHDHEGERIVLLTTKARATHTAFAFRATDVLLVGRESAGAPTAVHEAVAARVRVPIMARMRSLNVATAAAIVIGEALRQTGGFATLEPSRGERAG